MNTELRTLWGKFDGLLAQQRTYLKELDEKKISSDTDEQYQKRDAEINALQLRIQEEQKLIERENFGKDREERMSPQEREKPADRDELKGEQRDRAEFDQYKRYLLGNGTGDLIQARSHLDERELRRLGVNPGELRAFDGAAALPTRIRNVVVRELAALSTARASGFDVTTINGAEKIPIMSGATAALVTEGSGISETNPTLDVATFDPQKLVARTAMTWEQIMRLNFDVENEMFVDFARAIAELEDSYFFTGTGTDQPEGIFPASGLGKAAAATTDFTAEELMDLHASLDQRRQSRAVWYMNAVTFSKIRKLRSITSATPDEGDFLYAKLKDGSDGLLGRPVWITPYAPAATAGLKPIVFGDPKEAIIGDETGFQTLRDPYSESLNGRVRILMWRFTDCRVKRAAGFKHLLMDDGL